MALKGQDEGWRRPTMDEVAAAGRKTGLLRDEVSDEPDSEETVDEGGTSEDTPEAETEAEGEEQAGAESKEKEEPAAGEEEPEKRVVKIRGKEYTEEELEDLVEHGVLRQDDYTRKTMELAEERKEAREERQTYLKLNQALMQKAGILEQEGATEEEEIQDPVLKKHIQGLNTTIKSLTDKVEEGEQRRATEQQNDFVASVYTDHLTKLFDKEKVEPHLRPIISELIENKNPEIKDPITGRITEQSIRRAVDAAFRHYHTTLKGTQKKAQGQIIETLRKGTQALKPKPKQAPVKKAAVPPGKSPLLKRPPRDGWNSEEAVREVIERHSELSQTED